MHVAIKNREFLKKALSICPCRLKLIPKSFCRNSHKKALCALILLDIDLQITEFFVDDNKDSSKLKSSLD
ncbi:hypothetical protein A8F95_11765 [Bacillus wudalianchiensis]|uniref:Uncharacterized protein n=1 Tax=Pseudobacillus wudalianchiensis TaxID=1743143 RepID=A0A1B9AN39_9BACI|nr:hypothetical protein A8F95_11765 [Bacillus wudalianchiensis]